MLKSLWEETEQQVSSHFSMKANDVKLQTDVWHLLLLNTILVQVKPGSNYTVKRQPSGLPLSFSSSQKIPFCSVKKWQKNISLLLASCHGNLTTRIHHSALERWLFNEDTGHAWLFCSSVTRRCVFQLFHQTEESDFSCYLSNGKSTYCNFCYR